MKNESAINDRLDLSTHSLTEVLSKYAVTQSNGHHLPEILFITSYPPRECGIATYSQDLLVALNNQFKHSFKLNVCAVESAKINLPYPEEVKLILDATEAQAFDLLADTINHDIHIRFIMLQHEFGLFESVGDEVFEHFLNQLVPSIITTFHTVLPNPSERMRLHVKAISEASEKVVVMTQKSKSILMDDYEISSESIEVIAHGTHLVQHLSKDDLKEKYDLTGRKVLSTFGLLSSGKGIETTLKSMPSIVKLNPDVIFLIIGKTHPSVIQSEGERYRLMLEQMILDLELQSHVKFINRYLPLQDLLEYLQLTDIYLFTSKDPNQTVSGTFSYAMSCGCPIISTPISQAIEMLHEDTGIVIDFQNSYQLAKGVNRMMSDDLLRTQFSLNALQRIVPTAWENSAIAHALLIEQLPTAKNQNPISLHYRFPEIKLDHVKRMTTDFGMIQFSKINQPDLNSGYTLDDNARALIAICQHYVLTGDEGDLGLIQIYLNFISHCLQPDGSWLNYVNEEKEFTSQNQETNLADSNGRAIWALGFMLSLHESLPYQMVLEAESIIHFAIKRINEIHSTRAMAFTIKGLYYYNLEKKSSIISGKIKLLADRLVQMYRHESEHHWLWYESYLTYANSILPEALLCAWQDSNDFLYKQVAKTSFDFLLSLTFNQSGIKVISNKSWLHKGKEAALHGEQPIDVAYTILALKRFHQVFEEETYAQKMVKAFSWFLGHNHLHQIIYNPCTGGCYDGLEETHVNLNQGAESTLSYLMARIALEKTETKLIYKPKLLVSEIELAFQK